MKNFILGLFSGLIIMGITVWIMMPKMMINEYESKFDFNKTVSSVEKAVNEFDSWKTPKTFDIRQNILDTGFDNMTQVKIITLCQPNYAQKILSNDKDKVVSTMMPLGLGVYENNSGKVFIAEMNVSLMGMMFGGNVSDVMGDASNDIGKILEGIVEN